MFITFSITGGSSSLTVVFGWNVVIKCAHFPIYLVMDT